MAPAGLFASDDPDPALCEVLGRSGDADASSADALSKRYFSVDELTRAACGVQSAESDQSEDATRHAGEASIMGRTPEVRTDVFRARHVTGDRYARPVTFGRHRAMVRPHETLDLNECTIRMDTQPASAVRWIHDVFSNSVTLLDCLEPADTLDVEARFDIVRTSFEDAAFPLAEPARAFPFEYDAEARLDLGPLCAPNHDDTGGAWALLTAMTAAIQAELTYLRREAPGVQAPAETLALGSGSCRDYAELMCDAVRRRGVAPPMRE